MKSISEAVKYLLKAYVGGCVGCLGAWTATIVLIGALVFLAGPQLFGLVQGMIQPLLSGVPSLPSISPGTPFAEDCYKTIDAWVAKEEMGSPATDFAPTDGIFPIVENPTDCGKVKARLMDANGRVVMEKAYNVRSGRNGYGNFNPEKNLRPGTYTVEFWYGEIPLQTVSLRVK
ncbi:MAG: hypothetical protein H5T64_06845 [Chloroflexi bacterium]|nr:hypothetical protein [Chloroflexota bacterium]